MEKHEEFMETASNKIIHPFNLQMREVGILDIAQSLSMQPRFAGNLPDFYSVADHSVNVYKQVKSQASLFPIELRPRLELRALLHDSAEMMITDIPTPIKRWYPEIKSDEDLILRKIYHFYSADFNLISMTKWADAIIKVADISVLLGEKEDIKKSTLEWPYYKEYHRCPFKIEYTGHWKDSKRRFLKSFQEIVEG